MESGGVVGAVPHPPRTDPPRRIVVSFLDVPSVPFHMIWRPYQSGEVRFLMWNPDRFLSTTISSRVTGAAQESWV